MYNTTDEATPLVFTRLTHTAAATMGQEDSGLCGDGVIAATGSEGWEEGSVEGGGAEPFAGGSRWSVMSSSASGEVLVAEASRCSAVSGVVCILAIFEAWVGWSREF